MAKHPDFLSELVTDSTLRIQVCPARLLHINDISCFKVSISLERQT